VIEPRKHSVFERKPMLSQKQKVTSLKSIWEEISDSPGSKSMACTER